MLKKLIYLIKSMIAYTTDMPLAFFTLNFITLYCIVHTTQQLQNVKLVICSITRFRKWVPGRNHSGTRTWFHI